MKPPSIAPVVLSHARKTSRITGSATELALASGIANDPSKLSAAAQEAFRYAPTAQTPSGFALKADGNTVQERAPNTFWVAISALDASGKESTYASCYVDGQGRPKEWTQAEIKDALATDLAYVLITERGPVPGVIDEHELDQPAAVTAFGEVDLHANVDLLVTDSGKAFLRSELNAGDAPRYAYLGMLAKPAASAPASDGFATKPNKNPYI